MSILKTFMKTLMEKLKNAVSWQYDLHIAIGVLIFSAAVYAFRLYALPVYQMILASIVIFVFADILSHTIMSMVFDWDD